MEQTIPQRVFAIQKADKENVWSYGIGNYTGDVLPTKEENPLLNMLNLKNPKIELDNGGVVWGFECWWGPIEKYERICENKNIIEIKPKTP